MGLVALLARWVLLVGRARRVTRGSEEAKGSRERLARQALLVPLASKARKATMESRAMRGRLVE